MLMRTVVGAVVGTVVGGGFLLTFQLFVRWCNGGPTRTGCGAGLPLTIGQIFAFWLVVAGVLIYAGFRVARAERGWWAAGIGGGMWVALIVSFSFSGMFSKHSDVPFEPVAMLVSCLAYAIAALCVGRRRAW
jgi:hypothetical protein